MLITNKRFRYFFHLLKKYNFNQSFAYEIPWDFNLYYAFF